MSRRVFLIVLDSFGIGEAPDAAKFNDKGSNTLASIAKSDCFNIPTLQSLGIFNIKGVSCGKKVVQPLAAFARLQEASNGKDTTIGHWEIAGAVSETALPVFPNGFPDDFLTEFSKATGCKLICNKPYSGTDVLRDFGEEHIKTGALIVYTSADSVFQVAAHEDVVPVAKLYDYCEIARNMLKGKLGVGRVIARPFIGSAQEGFKRTSARHDFSLRPPKRTMLDELMTAKLDTIAVGKINDIFAGVGVSEVIRTKDNDDGMRVAMELVHKDFEGLCFINLVDFDMVYGHRNDIDGYATAATKFDKQLREFITKLNKDDLLIITADHGCDPGTPSTDHSREYVPMLCYGNDIACGVDLDTINGFGCIAATICDYLSVNCKLDGQSVLQKIKKK